MGDSVPGTLTCILEYLTPMVYSKRVETYGCDVDRHYTG